MFQQWHFYKKSATGISSSHKTSKKVKRKIKRVHSMKVVVVVVIFIVVVVVTTISTCAKASAWINAHFRKALICPRQFLSAVYCREQTFLASYHTHIHARVYTTRGNPFLGSIFFFSPPLSTLNPLSHRS